MKNDTRNALARIPLRWMIRECFKANTGIIFDARALKHEIGLDMGESGPTLKAPDLPLHPTQTLARRETPGIVTRVFDILRRQLWPRGYPQYPIHWNRTPEGEAQEELNDAVSPDDSPLDKLYWKGLQKMPGM